MKGKIISVKNDKNFIWYKFRPEILSLECIDNIRYFFDEYKEPKIGYHSKRYKNYLPINFGYHNKGSIYAIMICETDSVNYILIKSHKLFKKINKMIEKEFEFSKSIN